MAWMYILQCSDGSYYVGSTTDLERRLLEHEEGEGARYTKCRRPVTLVYSQEFESIAEAFYWEKRVQGWGRAKREALIKEERQLLPELARKRFEERGGAKGAPG